MQRERNTADRWEETLFSPSLTCQGGRGATACRKHLDRCVVTERRHQLKECGVVTVTQAQLALLVASCDVHTPTPCEQTITVL